MDVRELVVGSELIYPEVGGEIVRCPICGSIWMEDDEHTSNPCIHLRFVYCTVDHGFVCFANKWDVKSFKIAFVKKISINLNDSDYIIVFSSFSHPDVETVVFHEWNDTPLYRWITFWGFSSK